MNKSFSLFFLIFLPFFAFGTKIYNAIHPVACSVNQRKQFKKFYSENKVQYDLIIPENNLDQMECYTKQIKIESMPTTIFYVDIGLAKGGEECLLVLSQFDPNRPIILEANPTMSDFEHTCNKLILEQLNDEQAKHERIMSILQKELVKGLQSFVASDFKSEIHFFFISKMVQIGALRNMFELIFWGEHFQSKYAYLYNHFPKWVDELARNFKGQILKYVNLKFENHVNDKLTDEVFDLVKSDSKFITESLEKVKKYIHMLVVNAPENQIEASTYMVPSMIASECRIHQAPLHNFVNNYHRRIDLKKDLEWSLEMANDQEDSQENLALLLNQVDLMTPENFHFYVLEEFLMFGKKYEAAVYKILNVIKFPLSNWMTVPITNREIKYFTEFGLENKWLDARTFGEKTQVFSQTKMMINSNNGNEKYYFLEFSLNGDQTCVMLVKRLYSNSIEYQDELLLHTNEMYWNQKSCIVLTRNMLHQLDAGKYRRLV